MYFSVSFGHGQERLFNGFVKCKQLIAHIHEQCFKDFGDTLKKLRRAKSDANAHAESRIEILKKKIKKNEERHKQREAERERERERERLRQERAEQEGNEEKKEEQNDDDQEEEEEEEEVDEIDYEQEIKNLQEELKNFEESSITYKDELVRIEAATQLIRNKNTQVDLYSRDISNLVDLAEEENAKLYAYTEEGATTKPPTNLVKARGSYTLFTRVDDDSDDKPQPVKLYLSKEEKQADDKQLPFKAKKKKKKK